MYLSYKLLNTSVTSFLHIDLRDSHSIPNTPRIQGHELKMRRTKKELIPIIGFMQDWGVGGGAGCYWLLGAGAA